MLVNGDEAGNVIAPGDVADGGAENGGDAADTGGDAAENGGDAAENGGETGPAEPADAAYTGVCPMLSGGGRPWEGGWLTAACELCRD